MSQKMRFTDSELATIKAIFADRDDLLVLLRKVLHFAPLDEKEQKTVTEVFNNPTTHALLTKTFYPELDLESPVNQTIDMWMNLDIVNKDISDAHKLIRVRSLFLEWLAKGLLRISKPSTMQMPLSSYEPKAVGAKRTKSAEEKDVEELMARNYLISHIEAMLYQLYALAGQKTETVEQTKKRLQQNSSK